MSERILTLFGEEAVPEQLKAVGKSRAKKNPEKPKKEEKKIVTEKPAKTTEDTTGVNLPEDWSGDKQYYSIGEVAALFKVRTSHIRFWTNEFKLKVRTTRKGDRLYTSDQVRELRAIHHLVKERGFTLTGAKAKLKSQNKLDVETADLKTQLLQLRNKLLIIRNQLKPPAKTGKTTEHEKTASRHNDSNEHRSNGSE